MRRPLAAVVVTTVVVTTAALAAGCGSAGPQAATTTTTTSPRPTTASTTTTTVAPTTTTTGVPASPQATPDAAAGAFILAWEGRDLAAAARVATKRAVDGLFRSRYAGETLQDRGCQAPGPNPEVCSWGPYGGASPTNPLVEITLRASRHGWYVIGVVQEG